MGKSEQVAKKRHIYRLASRVVIWLGKESNDSSLAVTRLDEIGLHVCEEVICDYTRLG